jgi:hypothetical protein
MAGMIFHAIGIPQPRYITLRLEHREPLPQRAGIHPQRQFLFPFPPSQNGAEQIGKTRLNLDFSPFFATLGLCFVVKFSQSLPQPSGRNLLDFG